jgi:hypothetical protein
MKNHQVLVIIPDPHPNPPEPHEIEVATILAEHYKCVVEFIIPLDDYKRKTPDIVMNGVVMEIKSPTGKSRQHTIKYQFDRAMKQHTNSLVLDGRRTKLRDDFIEKQIRHELTIRHRIKQVVFINKVGKVLEFKK